MTLLTLSFLLTLITLFAVGLSTGLRGGVTWLLVPVAVIGTLIAYGLGHSRWKVWQAWVVLPLVGFAGILFQFSRLLDPLIELIKALIILRAEIIVWIKEREILPNPTATIQILYDSWQQINAVLDRTWVWLLGTLSGAVSIDPVARAFVWSLVVFLCAAWAGWMLARHKNPLAAFLPGLVIFAMVADYTYSGFIALWLMLGGILLLMGLNQYEKNHIHWQKSSIDYSESIPVDTGAAIVVVSLALAGIAWLIPSISLKALVDTARDWGKSQDHLAESFGLAPVPPPPSRFSPYITPRELPRSHLVGSGPELNDIIVMTIRTGELPPQSQESNLPPAPRHYWRSLTYDRYTGSGWISNPVDELYYEANVPLLEANPGGFQKFQQDVHILENMGGQLFWSGTLSSVNQPLEAAWRHRPVRSIPHDPFQGMDLLGVLGTGTTYTAYSLEASLTNTELRASTGPYPEGMQQYLFLPDTIPERVLALARDLTADKSTPYDRALAIESFLRNAYPYTLNVPAPPLGRDVADFFLFDLKKGYCDYYATAMVVLARAAGLPARFVSGYSSGTYDPETAEYVITEANAHSWPEIFFSDIGWVEFEPTAGLPAIDRSGVAAYSNQAPLQPSSSDSFKLASSQRSWTSLLGAVFIIITVVGFLFASFLWLESLWLLLLPPQARIEKVFDRMVRNGNRLGGAISAETPFEFSTRMTANLGKSSINTSALMKPAGKEITQITDTYVLSAYSHHILPANVSSNIVHMWRKLRVRLWWGRLILAIREMDRLRREGKG